MVYIVVVDAVEVVVVVYDILPGVDNVVLVSIIVVGEDVVVVSIVVNSDVDDVGDLCDIVVDICCSATDDPVDCVV